MFVYRIAWVMSLLAATTLGWPTLAAACACDSDCCQSATGELSDCGCAAEKPAVGATTDGEATLAGSCCGGSDTGNCTACRCGSTDKHPDSATLVELSHPLRLELPAAVAAASHILPPTSPDLSFVVGRAAISDTISPPVRVLYGVWRN